MPLPPLDVAPSDERLPSSAEVVIVGGGIVGASAALALAERRIPVVLCEKGSIGAEQSGRNWGWCRKQGRDARELPLMLESMRLWEDLARRVGADVGFRRTGIFYLARTPADLARHEAWLETARPYQLDTRLIGPAELARLLPGSGQSWAGALHTPSDGRAEPQKAAPAIANAARAAGAVVIGRCAVRGIETAGGRIAAAVTERGTVRCRALLLAGGAWSRLFLGSLGLTLPQLTVRASVMRTAPLAGGPEGAAKGPGFAFRKRLDGGYSIAHPNRQLHSIVPDSFRFFPRFLPVFLEERKDIQLGLNRRFAEAALTPRRWALDSISPFERCRVLDPEPATADLEAALKNLKAAWPVFREAAPAGSWAGMIDVMPDGVPVISTVPELPGLVVATGFTGHGFGIGPAAGRLAADLVTGAAPIVDPAPFRWSRFQGAKHGSQDLQGLAGAQ
ncbi:MAG: D-amino-acid oxidase [Rhodospirillales bacterium]|jgi:glycine/D-amino acid oxidase-like deaminating enzyme|nr:D-amino-acid oxidase [Rhodospirillales bacterium]